MPHINVIASISLNKIGNTAIQNNDLEKMSNSIINVVIEKLESQDWPVIFNNEFEIDDDQKTVIVKTNISTIGEIQVLGNLLNELESELNDSDIIENAIRENIPSSNVGNGSISFDPDEAFDIDDSFYSSEKED